MTDNNSSEFYTIDIMHILKSVLNRAWVVILSSVLAAVIGFSIASFAITPKYSSSIMWYVNNTSVSRNNQQYSISPSDITAAQSLLKTYSVILDNRTTLEEIIDKANLNYSVGELSSMIESSAVDDTEVMKVSVTSEDPNEAAKIVNCIAKVLPDRISDIIDGAKMEVVDSGIVNTQKVYPSVSKFTIIGFLLGFLLSFLVLAIMALMDNTIHDENYITQNYDYPILAKIPNLFGSNSKNYSYYSQHNKKGKGEAKNV